MKTIVFMWNNTRHEGTITDQREGGILGLITNISVTKLGDKPVEPNMMNFTMLGKCQVGKCGPYTVLSISGN